MAEVSNAPPTSQSDNQNSMQAPESSNPARGTTDDTTDPAPSSSSRPATEVADATSASSTKPLFSQSLISPTVLSALPENYTIRPLQRSDYANGFLDVLRVLTSVGDVSEERWNERYDWMRNREEYFILVVLDGAASAEQKEGRIVGTGALVVERKFIHNLGIVGHIEDIAVARDQQGKKLGLRIIQALDYVAEKVGCYKSILDCSEANEGFYVKCGFKRAGLEMAHYYEAPKSKYEAS